MPTYLIRIPQEEVVITTADITAHPLWEEIRKHRGGPGGSALEERIFLDWMMRQRADDTTIWQRTRDIIPFEWKVQGPIISSHTGTGDWVEPDIFRDNTDSPFTPASNPVGKMIHVPGGQGGGKNQARHRGIIVERINNSRVRIEGVVPAAVNSLDYNIRQMGPNVEAMYVITSMT